MIGERHLRPVVRRFDRKVDAAFDRLRTDRRVDRLFYLATEAGNFSALWHVLAWLPAFVRPCPRRFRRAVEVSAALAVESALVNGPVKSVFRRARPVLGEGTRTYRVRRPRTTSFPSGHATAAMVAAAMLGRRSRLRPVYYALALFVAASRVHVRIHHASDVVGGMIIGGLLGRVARRLLP